MDRSDDVSDRLGHVGVLNSGHLEVSVHAVLNNEGHAVLHKHPSLVAEI